MEKIETEIWKPIAGYECAYEISNFGRIKSLPRTLFRVGTGQRPGVRRSYVREKIRTGYVNNHGYRAIHLSLDGSPKMINIHRLVAVAFIPNPESRPDINHINGIKTDNRVSNLEWTTASENIRHAYRTGLMPSLKGENRKFNILKESDIPLIRSKRGIVPMAKIASEYGVCMSTIHAVMQRRSWSHVP